MIAVVEALIELGFVALLLTSLWFVFRAVRDGLRPTGAAMDATADPVYVGSTVYFDLAGSVRRGEVMALGPGPNHVTVRQDDGSLHRVPRGDVTIDPSSLQ
ncbi:MAG: hypothetical protein ABJA87_07055 [bacterium]